MEDQDQGLPCWLPALITQHFVLEQKEKSVLNFRTFIVHVVMVKTLGENSPSYSSGEKWVADLKWGIKQSTDDNRCLKFATKIGPSVW